MSVRKGFALALRQIRNSKNLTQEDFSEISSRTYLSSLERAMKSPTLDKVEELATVMEIHPLTLLTLSYCHVENITLNEIFFRVTKEMKILADQK